MKPIQVHYVRTRDTKNCHVFEELPATGAQAQVRSPLYLPIDPKAAQVPVALKVTIEATATEPAPAPSGEPQAQAPATPAATGKRATAARK